MDLGSANDILASNTMAENLIRLKPEYAKMIKRQKTRLTKHGEPITVYVISPKKPSNKGIISSKSSDVEIIERKYEGEVLDVKRDKFLNRLTWTVKNNTKDIITTHEHDMEFDAPLTVKQMKYEALDEYGKKLPQTILLDEPKSKVIGYEIPHIKPGKIGVHTVQFNSYETKRYQSFEIGSPTNLFHFSLTYPKSARYNVKAYLRKDSKKSNIPVEIRYSKTHNRNVARCIIDRLKVGQTLLFKW